jgi:hypothetical protein
MVDRSSLHNCRSQRSALAPMAGAPAHAIIHAKGGAPMASFSHEPSRVERERQRLPMVAVREMWVSLAITVVWLVVFADALYGPDIVASSGSGGATTTVPSAVVVAGFAFLTSWIVAKYGLRSDREG